MPYDNNLISLHFNLATLPTLQPKYCCIAINVTVPSSSTGSWLAALIRSWGQIAPPLLLVGVFLAKPLSYNRNNLWPVGSAGQPYNVNTVFSPPSTDPMDLAVQCFS